MLLQKHRVLAGHRGRKIQPLGSFQKTPRLDDLPEHRHAEHECPRMVSSGDNHSAISKILGSSSAVDIAVVLSIESGSLREAANRRACNKQRRIKAATNALDQPAVQRKHEGQGQEIAARGPLNRREAAVQLHGKCGE